MRSLVALVLVVVLIAAGCTADGDDTTRTVAPVMSTTSSTSGTIGTSASSSTPSTPSSVPPKSTTTATTVAPTSTTSSSPAPVVDVPIPGLLHRIDDLPALPVGSRLADFTFNPSGGPSALIETPDGWQVWLGPGGDASWQVEFLPDEVFAETRLDAVMALADTTYVAGHQVHGIPAVWRRNPDATWTAFQVENEAGPSGAVNAIVECGGEVVFIGHHSASNQVLERKVWRFDENGDLKVVFNRGGGPPGSGIPPPAVYCHDGSFMALVTLTRERWPSVDFTFYNEIWSSPTGLVWSLDAADTIHPAILPRDIAVVRAFSAFWVVSQRRDIGTSDIATSSDGVRWTRIDRTAAGLEPDSWIDTMSGGGLGLFITGHEHLGEPIDPIMWWTADGRHWERIDDHPALDPRGVEMVVQPTSLMIALHRSFEEGAPVMWVYAAAG